jgi:hypothetical protein
MAVGPAEINCRTGQAGHGAGTCDREIALQRIGLVSSSPPIPTQTPRQLFAAFDRGELSREAFRKAMNEHALLLIEEMEEVHQNPVAAWMEHLRSRRAAGKLAREHGEAMVRELFVALSEVPEFPLARWLWNADRPHLPLYCFLRPSAEPVFRVQKIVTAPFVVMIRVEYGSKEKGAAVREKFTFTRDRVGRLEMTERERVK